MTDDLCAGVCAAGGEYRGRGSGAYAAPASERQRGPNTYGQRPQGGGGWGGGGGASAGAEERVDKAGGGLSPRVDRGRPSLSP